jgi:hypothetical protein
MKELRQRFTTRTKRITILQRKLSKIIGFEFVKETVLPLLRAYYSNQNKLNTFTKHVAIQIAAAPIKRKIINYYGGSYNDFLIENIKTDCLN